jgi:hypothetical protein
MDCKTARLLLELGPLHRAELHASEAEALEGHLAGCAECEGVFRHERRLDSHLATAMRTVPVPDGLRSRLLKGLTRERNTWYRGWAARGAAAAAIAASLFLAFWLYLRPSKPTVDVEELRQDFGAIASWDPETVRDLFNRKFRANVIPPVQFDYRLLTHCDVTEYRGQRVPVLVFVRNRDRGSLEQAWVLVLSASDFDLKDLVPQVSWPSGPMKVRALQDVEGVTYLVFYTSDRLESFFLPAANPPRA